MPPCSPPHPLWSVSFEYAFGRNGRQPKSSQPERLSQTCQYNVFSEQPNWGSLGLSSSKKSASIPIGNAKTPNPNMCQGTSFKPFASLMAFTKGTTQLQHRVQIPYHYSSQNICRNATSPTPLREKHRLDILKHQHPTAHASVCARWSLDELLKEAWRVARFAQQS